MRPIASGAQVLAVGFEQNRTRLRAVAYRMLGSLAEADDAVQEAWLRASRAGADDIDSLSAWLTTIVARVPRWAWALFTFKLRAEESISSTGRSPGLAPRRSLSTYAPARRQTLLRLGPSEIRPPATTCSR